MRTLHPARETTQHRVLRRRSARAAACMPAVLPDPVATD